MKPRLIDFPTHHDWRGNLTVIEKDDLPFEVKRAFFVHSVALGAWRGRHALKTCHLLLVPVVGSFTVTLDDRDGYHMYNRARGLYVPPMTWIELDHFSHDAIYWVLASEEFDAGDYINDYGEFLKEKEAQK